MIRFYRRELVVESLSFVAKASSARRNTAGAVLDDLGEGLNVTNLKFDPRPKPVVIQPRVFRPLMESISVPKSGDRQKIPVEGRNSSPR